MSVQEGSGYGSNYEHNFGGGSVVGSGMGAITGGGSGYGYGDGSGEEHPILEHYACCSFLMEKSSRGRICLICGKHSQIEQEE